MNLDDSTLPFLHGTLIVGVHEANDLPDTDRSWFHSSKNVTDAYVQVELYPVGLKIAETRVVKDSLYPAWEEQFRLSACYNADYIRVRVKDCDMLWTDNDIGVCEFTIKDLTEKPGEVIQEWHDLTCGPDEDVQGSILISLQYIPFGDHQDDSRKTLDSYFPDRSNNKVSLYQCADTPHLPVFQGIPNPDESEYVPTRLWRDIYNTICSAQKLIYIAGWSVFTEICLLRGEDEPDGTSSHLGELLKRKAEEGVTVLLLIWNDKSSGSVLGREGMMKTHDEKTEEYFAGSGVCVANVPRVLEGGGAGMVESEMAETVYTHHQKTVIADAEIADSDKRRLVGYIGGIDLTDGRWDTPEFPLFDYSATHGSDFYQGCTMGATSETGPRQPWQDIHAKIEGPAVLDILENFTERWRKQAEDKIGHLVDFTEDEYDLEYVVDDGTCLWNTQIFRSCTSDSIVIDQDKENTLTGKRGHLIDNSIFKAYVQSIRTAKHFIYIENQYFLGSAYSWNSNRDAKTHHTLPREIVSKIVQSIESGQKFTVYITIPMYPEGDPTSMASQEILFWQRRTMESMYFRIGNAIRMKGLDTKPTDYLMFFCLGKRETAEDVPDTLEDPPEDSPASRARESIRHPVYVHSKLMIVDDDYIIVGSANINQRSMAGSRDSEIAMGAFQVDFLADTEDIAKGDVHTFRLALWSAHLGEYDPVFANPNSEECVAKVKEITKKFQQVYAADVMEEKCDVHMMEYPIQVNDDGSVEDHPDWVTFPDQGGDVAGKESKIFPGNVTT